MHQIPAYHKAVHKNLVRIFDIAKSHLQFHRLKIILEKLKVVADDNNIEATINMSNQNPVVENSGKIRPIMYCA